MIASGAGSWWLYTTAKEELAPMEDRGVIFMPINAPDGSTLEYTARYLDAVVRIAASHPEFDRRFLFAGGNIVSGGTAILRTVDWTERKRSTQDIARAMLPQVGALPGVTVFPITPASLGQGFR